MNDGQAERRSCTSNSNSNERVRKTRRGLRPRPSVRRPRWRRRRRRPSSFLAVDSTIPSLALAARPLGEPLRFILGPKAYHSSVHMPESRSSPFSS